MSSSSTSLELLGQDLKNLSLSSNPQTPNVLQHFLHDHPLIFKVAETNDKKETTGCKICGEYISLDGQIYHCEECSFSIHKSCAELPKQVRNMLHPAHLLELIKSSGFSCDACGFYHFICCSYKCYECDFNLDIKCVISNSFEEPQGHKEHEYKVWKPTLFTCDVCGLDEVTKSCISYVCTTCYLQVHNNCISSSYPFTIKEPRHSHKLNLTFSFQMGDLDFADKICKICFHKMNKVFFMYSCDQCAYITHVRCGTRTNLLDVDLVGEIESLMSPSSSLRSTETHQNDQIEHFSHPHSLFLNTEEPEGDNIIICDGCVRPIYAPFYACDQCNFFLHRDCVELPNKIYSPLHAHQLTLITTWDRLSSVTRFEIFSEYVAGFSCYGCDSLCNGFMYQCVDCYFYLDVGCSFLPSILQLESHECVSEKQKIKETHVGGELTLIDILVRHKGESSNSDYPEYRSNCNACGLSCINKYVCQGCDFDLDLVCASLPQTILHECPKHGWKKHPFKLKYHDIEDVSGMYICDECEEERDINHWYYYCEDCKYSAHPRCLVGHDRTKYGRSYEVKQHPHPVRLLKEPRLGWKYSCATCMKPLAKSGPALSCEECNIYFHCEVECL